LKIHLCCGDVYLKDYINIDGMGKIGTKDGTTLKHYYTGNVHENKQVIVDEIRVIPYELDYKDVDEYLMISSFEHFSLRNASELVKKVHSTLKKGGVFRFDFPDVLATIKKHIKQPEYMMRLIYGSGKNEYSFHRHGYTKETIKRLLEPCNWKSIKFGDIVKHEYPMIGVTATK